ncbi:MAG: hypothetical protein Q8K63_15855, partial [Acidimicrobiales bacterium]|nr:hypothetical protein [Acidimicrobiales bacterium]
MTVAPEPIFEPELPWDSPKFREKKDTPWMAGCRWLASWWREQGGFQPGERTDISETLVGAMFPVDTDAEHNFFGPNVTASLEDRVLEGAEFGVVSTEVLFRSLLEKQVLLFNLIGEFVKQPNALLPWVQTIDPSAAEVTEIRIEWQPDRKLHHGGGPGFDAFVEYRSRLRGARRFLALETSYAEDPERSTLSTKPVHVEATDANPLWRRGAPRRLDRPGLRQYWIPTLVAQSLVANGDYDAGRVVAMSCVANPAPEFATNFVRAELHDPDASLVLSSFDAFVDALAPAHPEWAAYIRRRYLDFGPVLHLLDVDDPRVVAPRREPASDELSHLLTLGKRRSALKAVAGADPAQLAA